MSAPEKRIVVEIFDRGQWHEVRQSSSRDATLLGSFNWSFGAPMDFETTADATQFIKNAVRRYDGWLKEDHLRVVVITKEVERRDVVFTGEVAK